MNIVLFHSTYGLRPAVREAAERLRAEGACACRWVNCRFQQAC